MDNNGQMHAERNSGTSNMTLNNIGSFQGMLSTQEHPQLPPPQQDAWMMKMMMTQMEQCNFLTKENQRLVLQNFSLQKETSDLRAELQEVKLELSRRDAEVASRRAVEETRSTQTGSLGIIPFPQYVISGVQASTSIRLAVQGAIGRHELRLNGNATKTEKTKGLRKRDTAAREILWELGYANNDISDTDVAWVRKRISSTLSNRTYDTKPDVIEKKKKRRQRKKSGNTSTSSSNIGVMTSVSLELSEPQSSSSSEESHGVDSILSSSSGDSSLDNSDSALTSHLQSTPSDNGNNIQFDIHDEDLDQFDPMNPNDPNKMEIGMIVAIATEDEEKDVSYAMLLEKPVRKNNEWSAKVHYFEQLQNDKLGDTTGSTKVESMKHVIMADVSTGEDGMILNIDTIRSRFNRYFDKWFVD